VSGADLGSAVGESDVTQVPVVERRREGHRFVLRLAPYLAVPIPRCVISGASGMRSVNSRWAVWSAPQRRPCQWLWQHLRPIGVWTSWRHLSKG